MLTNFDAAVAYVMKNEGGFTDNPNDDGGVTNYGISLRFLKSLPVKKLIEYGVIKLDRPLLVNDVKNLDIPTAKFIYKGEFWDKAPLDKILNSLVCTYTFDMVVNVGLSEAITILQRSTWALDFKDHIPDDGVLGQDTLKKVNMYGSLLLPSLRSERAGYVRLVSAIHSNDKEFLNGWLDRCYRI